MKKWIQNNALYIAGSSVGAVSGYLYWKFAGCASGTCAITGNPFNSTIYFAILGALLFGLFKKERISEPDK